MATNTPIGWQTSRFNMHYKSVFPEQMDAGLYFSLHRNMRKQLLPREIKEEANNIAIARRILYRQRLMHRSQRPPRDKLRSIVRKASRENICDTESSNRPQTSPEAQLKHYRQYYLPPVTTRSLPMTPGSRYSARDIKSIVERLSTYDPVKIPESKGYVVKLPTPIVYKKKYSEDEVRTIVERLSEYDPDRHPPESKGIPIIVPRIARQTMKPPPKCTSDEVQDVVERLCAVHFEPPDTPGTMRGTTRGTSRYEPTPIPVTR